MNTSAMTLVAMRAVLRQGAALDRFSLLLLAVAIVLLGVAQAPPLIQLSFALSAAAGLMQRYWVFRVGLDVDLLDGVIAQVAHGNDEAQAAQHLDTALHALGLRATLPPTRAWSARWIGMRRLLRWQLASVASQLLWMVAALALRVFG
ncbi:hypothetical protein [Xanthomonas vesicatoria]|uniref:hypothetical protein n=1 Tax=Xanthomonas vesicatoria TaxID=56460 RepID=UPI001E61CD7B|nr:hypothetical protein [Xanthomonas vesicatoria]MCC8627277.1 hypothetical protein [Xanthomonas vesicatoria]MDG4484038.1 hypothetical protein [Xanthomonas vesicatoria]